MGAVSPRPPKAPSSTPSIYDMVQKALKAAYGKQLRDLDVALYAENPLLKRLNKPEDK